MGIDFFLFSFFLCSGTPPVDFLLPFLEEAGVAADASGSVGPSAASVFSSPVGAVTSVVACLPAISSSSLAIGASPFVSEVGAAGSEVVVGSVEAAG